MIVKFIGNVFELSAKYSMKVKVSVFGPEHYLFFQNLMQNTNNIGLKFFKYFFDYCFDLIG